MTDLSSNSDRLCAILFATAFSAGVITGLVLCMCAIHLIRKMVRCRKRGDVHGSGAGAVPDSHKDRCDRELHVNLGALNESIYDEIRATRSARRKGKGYPHLYNCSVNRPEVDPLDACSLHQPSMSTTSFYHQAMAVHKKRQKREKKQSPIQRKVTDFARVQTASVDSCDENVVGPGPDLDGKDSYGYLHPTL